MDRAEGALLVAEKALSEAKKAILLWSNSTFNEQVEKLSLDIINTKGDNENFTYNFKKEIVEFVGELIEKKFLSERSIIIESVQEHINSAIHNLSELVEKKINDIPVFRDGTDINTEQVIFDLTNKVKSILSTECDTIRRYLEELIPVAVKGDPGDRGEKGDKGEPGVPGVGLSNVEIDKEGQLSITYTNGLIDTLETVVGRNGIDGKTPEIDTEQIRSIYTLDMDKRFENLYEEFVNRVSSLESDIRLLHQNTKQNLEETDIHNIVNPIRIDLEKQITSGLDEIKNIVAKIQEREKTVVIEKEKDVENIPDVLAEKVAQASRVLAESINLPQPQPTQQPIVVNVPSTPASPSPGKSKRIVTRRDENGNLVAEVTET